MIPVLPGSTSCVHGLATVQPHFGSTLLITSFAFPVFVKTKSCFTISPSCAVPKSKTGVSNWISAAPMFAVAPAPTGGAVGACRPDTESDEMTIATDITNKIEHEFIIKQK